MKLDTTSQKFYQNYYQSINTQNYQQRPKVPVFFKYLVRKQPNQINQLKLSRKNSINPNTNGFKEDLQQKAQEHYQRYFKNDTCRLCEYVINQKDLISLCNCQHKFCQFCLHKYVTYKVNMNEQILCPQEDCHQKINQKSNLFLNLPARIKDKYKINKLWRQTMDNPNLRLCPRQNCKEGLINLLKIPPQCQKCFRTYCKNCQLQAHNGSCENNFQNLFYQWKKCPYCGVFIQKIDGCNHIICICRHEFCYRCSSPWTNGHNCSRQTHQQYYLPHYNYNHNQYQHLNQRYNQLVQRPRLRDQIHINNQGEQRQNYCKNFFKLCQKILRAVLLTILVILNFLLVLVFLPIILIICLIHYHFFNENNRIQVYLGIVLSPVGFAIFFWPRFQQQD